jgi:hypothetical protein
MDFKLAAIAKATYCTNRFTRLLKALRRTDKCGAAAAERAEKLVRDISKGELSEEELLAKQTKYGELRLQKCRKFDLGSGYRLIGLREKNRLCFVFVGTHDDCDRWLDQRRSDGFALNAEQLTPIKESAPAEQKSELPAELVAADQEYEAYIASKLDEETLRYLFRGLRGCL